MKAYNTHCIQQNNQFLLNETAIFQFSKSWIWKFQYKKKSEMIHVCSHLVFKLSSTSSHTRSKFLSSLSNCFINYALVKLVPFLSKCRRRSSSTSYNACLVNPFLQHASDLVVAGLGSDRGCWVATNLMECSMVYQIIRYS